MSKLYTPQILALTAELARYPLTGDFELSAQGRSKVCGSTMELGLDLDREGRIARVGMQVVACAIGQSSAAIMAGAISGRSAAEMRLVLESAASWLTGKSQAPDWPGFEKLEPAVEHAGRHGALLLPWETAVKALSSTS